MNIFFNQIGGDVSSDLCDRILKKYLGDGQAYIVYWRGDPNFDESKIKKNDFRYDEIFAADHSNCVFYEDCPPIDTALLETIAEHEPEIIKMFERLSYGQYSFEARVSKFYAHLRYWNYMLDTAKIELAVFTNTPHEGWDYIIYCLCKEKGIITVFPYFSSVEPYGYFASDIRTQGAGVLEHYNRLAEQYKNTPIEEIELPHDFLSVFDLQSGNEDKTPYYMKEVKRTLKIKSTLILLAEKVLRKIRKSLFKNWFKIIRFYFGKGSGIFQRHYRLRKLRGAYERLAEQADFSQPYIYLPLHYQPELTSCPMGGIFVRQLLIAEMLSFYLPNGVWIYVKEHPMQTDHCREAQLYSDLAALPNVKLVHRNTDTYKLLEHCVAIASCTGTAGFEGMFMGKPFLVFGYHINMYAPGAYVIRNNEDCKYALDKIFNNGAKHTLKDLKIFLKAVSEITSKCMEFNMVNRDSSPNAAELLYIGLSKVIDSQLTSAECSVS